MAATEKGSGGRAGSPAMLRELPASRFDLSTYWGRVQHAATISSPFNLLHSNEDIRHQKSILDEYRAGRGGLSPEVWKAKQIVDSAVHPDTGEIVLFPLRMSSYVLSNLVVTLGMLTPNMGTAGIVFWQVANQSLNVAVNTANANKSRPLTTKQLATSYFLAVGGSCSVALGLNALVPRLRGLSAGARAVLGRLVPFAAVVSAGILNVFLMRSQEIRKGITVFDADSGKPLGDSRKAAKKAVFETALSRAITAAPVMVVPPLVLYKLQQGPLRNKPTRTVAMANLALITLTSFAVLPFALAIFPQRREVAGASLEPEFASAKRVWFNRGI